MNGLRMYNQIVRITTIFVVTLATGCMASAPRPRFDPNFNDHTVPRMATIDEFVSRAVTEFGLSTTKFVVTSFDDETHWGVRFYDSHFYHLHDEWYWFRLLNGQPVPGDDTVPVGGTSFGTVGAIYAWAHAGHDLPLDLSFYDNRIYSRNFYDHSFGPSRRFGLGTLVYIPARGTSPERWAFELEFSDAITHETLTRYFDVLRGQLPETVVRNLHFLVRSAEQEALATQMQSSHLRYHDRILRYRDIVVPGAREVYSDGITAGRLRLVRQSDTPTTTPQDILVFEAIPDLLPAAAGVITAVPQTPLAHINLLARNRGIPNAHIAGVLEDATVGQFARGYAPVILRAESPNHVEITPISEEQFLRYNTLSARPTRSIATPAPSSLQYVLDLATQTPASLEALRPSIGGKSSGMLALLASPGLETPYRPHAITSRAYTEHMASLRQRIDACLNDEVFQRDASARLLTLQGEASFRALRTSQSDQDYVTEFLRIHGPNSLMGALCRNGGIRKLVETTPIRAETLQTIETTLRSAYSDLAPTQGIRFRSSSNVEDIEGFNGAGLYESFTGFFDAASQPEASNRNKTIARAIAKVWGSYWSFEAFEERRLERIDHLSAAMTVFVHPRFDDALERSTGVCTFTILPPNSPDAEQLEVNVQAGSESVANPNPQVLPEVVRVVRSRTNSTLRFERVRRSSLAPNRALLDDEQLRRLFQNTSAVTHAWIERENSTRSPERHTRTLTLDFEFHDMAAGYPTMRTGPQRPARLVLKQVRTLEPGARTTLPEAALWPVPRDIFVRARRVSLQTCAGTLPNGITVTTTALRVLTDASLPPDVGFANVAFEAFLDVRVRGGEIAALSLPADAHYEFTHRAYTVSGSDVRMYQMSPETLTRTPIDRIQMGSDESIALSHGSSTVTVAGRCHEDVQFATPRDYLLGLLPATTR
jgi:hypothetical protein